MQKALHKHACAICNDFKGFLDEKREIFFLFFFALNIDCGYTFEPPHRNGANR